MISKIMNFFLNIMNRITLMVNPNLIDPKQMYDFLISKGFTLNKQENRWDYEGIEYICDYIKVPDKDILCYVHLRDLSEPWNTSKLFNMKIKPVYITDSHYKKIAHNFTEFKHIINDFTDTVHNMHKLEIRNKILNICKEDL